MCNRRTILGIICVAFLTIGCGKTGDEIGLSSIEVTGAEDEQSVLGEEVIIEESNTVEEVVSVYICGAVNSPGVYEFKASERVTHAIDRAGGFTGNADTQFWNLAQVLTDGEMIYVPTKEEIKSGFTMANAVSENGVDSSGKVNINTASKDQLMSLAGVGEAKALSIISYRDINGSFAAIEDVMKISGIKDAVFNTIKDHITV